jgi:hypothetical protein
MTAEDFRRLALAMPGVSEGAHSGHADFHADGRIFATLGYPDGRWAMVKLQPEQQAAFVAAAPQVFSPAKGGWGRQGSTLVRLELAGETTAKDALSLAWTNLHP